MVLVTWPLAFLLLVYLGISALSLVVFTPMLLVDSRKLMAKKILGIIFSFYPCLVLTCILFAILFGVPAFALYLLSMTIFKIYLVLFLGIAYPIAVMVASIYIWNFIRKVIYQQLDKKQIHELLNSNRIFNLLQPFLIKLRLYTP